MNQHVIEPELQRSVPRPIKCRTGFWGALRPLWILLLPHTWIAIAAPLYLCALYLHEAFPSDARGTIIERTSKPDRHGPHYRLRLTYVVKGKNYTDTLPASEDTWRETQIGQAIPLKISKPMPWFEPVLAQDHNDIRFRLVWYSILGWWWSIMLLPYVYRTLRRPMRIRRLCRNGSAVIGELLKTSIETGRKNYRQCYVHYQYTTAEQMNQGQKVPPYEALMCISDEQEKSVAAGTKVTVLYDPRAPESSIVYQFSDYTAV